MASLSLTLELNRFLEGEMLMSYSSFSSTFGFKIVLMLSNLMTSLTSLSNSESSDFFWRYLELPIMASTFLSYCSMFDGTLSGLSVLNF